MEMVTVDGVRYRPEHAPKASSEPVAETSEPEKKQRKPRNKARSTTEKE